MSRPSECAASHLGFDSSWQEIFIDQNSGRSRLAMQGINVDHKNRPSSWQQSRSPNKPCGSGKSSTHVHSALGRHESTLYSKHARPRGKLGRRTPLEKGSPLTEHQKFSHHETSNKSEQMTVLGDLTRLRKLIIKRGRKLSRKENVKLIRTLQKVKELSVSAEIVKESEGKENPELGLASVQSGSSCSQNNEQIIEGVDSGVVPFSESCAPAQASDVLDQIREEFFQSLHSSDTLRAPDIRDLGCKVDVGDEILRDGCDGLEDSLHLKKESRDDGALCFDSLENGSVPEETSSNAFNYLWPENVTNVRVDHAEPEHAERSAWSISVDALLMGHYKPTSHNISNDLYLGDQCMGASSQHQVVGSSSRCPIQPEPSHRSLVRGDTSEVYRTLDRRLEKERRVRTEPPPARVEPNGMFGEDFPPVEVSLAHSGFRPGSKHPYFQKNEHPLISTSYRYGNPKDYGAPLSSISGSSGATSALQGHRVGIASRERQTTRQPASSRNVRLRNGSSFSAATGDRSKGYLYPDTFSGGGQGFQDRLVEIANLENDTVRYEKTRKVKKKAKQEK